MNIRDKVAVIGAGCCKFGENYHQSAEDMIVDAALEAYTDAGIDPSQIQAAWVGTLSSASAGNALADPLKLFNIPITRVENYCASGMDAFRNACMAVASGMYDVVLALGFEKLRDSGQRGLGRLGRTLWWATARRLRRCLPWLPPAILKLMALIRVPWRKSRSKIITTEP